MKLNYFSDLAQLIKSYVWKCCEVSWLCVLHRPLLNIYPRQFWAKEGMNTTKFDATLHERKSPSKAKCDNILYCMWPVLRDKDTVLQKEKICVITKDEAFDKDSWQQKKSKKKKSKHGD